MAQRIYWAPHTVCFLGCEHCHNDSIMAGVRSPAAINEAIIAHLPGPESRYRLDEVLIGGGEALMRHVGMEQLVVDFRRRFPRGPQKTVAERRAAGHVILALQTMGLPLADGVGTPMPKLIDTWLGLGVDYFHVASNDIFHEDRRPDYPWEALRRNLASYGAAHDIQFHIYGKPAYKLVPSGRVLDNLPALEALGARLLTDVGYCATAWEAAASFLSGVERPYPYCSEVVIDPAGWVHPCCWYELAPGLFDLTATDFEAGMEALAAAPICQALDAGDVIGYAGLAGIDEESALRVRNVMGDCGLCRIASARLARDPGHAWINAPPLARREITFYGDRLRPALSAALGLEGGAA